MSRLAAKVTVQQTTVAGYQVLTRIGNGSSGTVYKAQHPQTGNLVAVKLVDRAVISDAVQRLRFAQECQVSRQLDHPHIVRVLDFGLHGDRAYMIMEFVDGPSLGARLDQGGALPEAEALRIIQQVGQALHWAHQRRIIHRDVKPDNVLLGADGQAKLSDLGLAKDLESEQSLTRPNSGLGTPNFMAPEQFEGAKDADVRSDLYGLAATLYMMLTAELPFRTPSTDDIMAACQKQRANDIIPPRQLVPSLSARVEAAILRALRADPAERFASVNEFLDALGVPATSARPAGDRNGEKKDAAAAGVKPEKTEKPRPRGRELRRKERYPCNRKTACRAMERPLTEGWKGQVVNISEGGLCLELGRRFEPGAILTVALDAETAERRSVLVRVVWVDKTAKQVWKHGCQYDQPLADFEVHQLRS